MNPLSHEIIGELQTYNINPAVAKRIKGAIRNARDDLDGIIRFMLTGSGQYEAPAHNSISR